MKISCDNREAAILIIEMIQDEDEVHTGEAVILVEEEGVARFTLKRPVMKEKVCVELTSLPIWHLKQNWRHLGQCQRKVW
jgi:hypothetical protein